MQRKFVVLIAVLVLSVFTGVALAQDIDDHVSHLKLEPWQKESDAWVTSFQVTEQDEGVVRVTVDMHGVVKFTITYACKNSRSQEVVTWSHQDAVMKHTHCDGTKADRVGTSGPEEMLRVPNEVWELSKKRKTTTQETAQIF